jgi:hypothetical protein
MLSTSARAAAAFLLAPAIAESKATTWHETQPMTANGGTDPYPIPWLDKNGSHNQPAGPNLEPAHIYHSRDASRAAALSLGWELTTRGTASLSEVPRPTTA